MSNYSLAAEYNSPKTLGNIVIALFGAIIVFNLSYIPLSFVAMAGDAADLISDQQEIQPGFYLLAVLGSLESLVRFGLIIMFLIWLYRCHKNLPALGAENLEFSPGWAVGWWFIPFLCLYKPFQVVREVWNESDPDVAPDDIRFHVAPGAPTLMVLWWALFLIGNFISSVPNFFWGHLESFREGFRSALIATIVSSIVQVASAGTALMVVRGINQRQDERYTKWQTMPWAPPPPVFSQEDRDAAV